GNVLVIHQLFLRERQRFHDGSGLVLGLRVDQEDDAFAIAARIPLADLPIEIELHICPDLLRYDGHDLLRGYARLGSQNDEHFGGFRYRHAGHAWALPDCDCAMGATGSIAARTGIMNFICLASLTQSGLRFTLKSTSVLFKDKKFYFSAKHFIKKFL